MREFKSTLLVSSVQALRERGHLDAYLARITPAHRERMLFTVVGVWLPIELAIEHWAATHSLRLPIAEQLQMGAAVHARVHTALLRTIGALARGSGATPWTALNHFQSLFERMFRGGGGTRVIKLGPKEARLEIAGFPLAGNPYFRTSFRAFLQAGGDLFCARIYVNDVPAMCTANKLAYRAAWA